MLHLIHLLEGALLLYYTPTWECLAIVLYCTLPLPMAALLLYSPYIVLYTYLRGVVLYYTPTWGDFVLYYIVLYTYLRGPCYCPGDWRRRQALPFSPAVQTVLLHPLSKYENKKKPTLYNKCRLIFNYIHTTNNLHSMEQHDKFYAWVRHT